MLVGKGKTCRKKKWNEVHLLLLLLPPPLPPPLLLALPRLRLAMVL